MATSGKEWRKARENGIPTVLATGMEADLRPVEVDFFLMIGKVPNLLAPLINEIISGIGEYKLAPPPSEEMEKNVEWAKFLRELCIYAFVNPKVVENPQSDNEISVDDIAYVDKFFVFRRFAEPAHRMKGFRARQIKPVADLEPIPSNGLVPVKDPAS